MRRILKRFSDKITIPALQASHSLPGSRLLLGKRNRLTHAAAAFLCLLTLDGGQAQTPPKDFLGEDHMREELGVNVFTAPSIDQILKILNELHPLPYDKLAREIPTTPSNRVNLSLSFGGLIADGFLIVECERVDQVEPMGRAVLSFARAMGVADNLSRRSKSMTELAKAGNWKKLRAELAAAQAEAEDAMIAIRDEENAHLISLGGWLRGLEISSAAIADQPFSPAKAARLFRLDLLDYFLDRLDTLNPATKRMPLIARIIDQLKVLRTYFDLPDGKSLTEKDVQEIEELSHRLNELITPERKKP